MGGPAPGRHQTDGASLFILGAEFGNVFVGVQPAFGWAADYARTTNGLPCIGPHRNFPHHLFAFGDASQGVTGAYLASRVLLRHYLDERDPADEAFAFTRNVR